MAMQKFLDHRSEIPDLGNDLGFWATVEDNVGVFKNPTATQAVFLISEFVPNMEPNLEDDKQRRPGSASKQDPILLRINHGTGTAECYARTGGKNANPGTDDASLPQAHDLLYAALGSYSRSKNLKDSIASLVSHARTSTVITVADGTKYAVGDICTLILADTSRLGHMETRRISAISTNTITFTPGFSSKPTTSDKIQNGLAYKLAQDISAKTVSILSKYGKAAKACAGNAVQKFTPKIDGVGAHTHSFEIGIRNVLAMGTDHIKDDGSGATSFTNSDTTLKVFDYRLFPVGSQWKMLQYTVSSGALAATEGATTPLVVTANPGTGVITFTRGDNPVAATALYAVDTSHEVAETYDVSTNKYLDLNIDHRGWITIDVTSPTAPAIPAAATAAEIVANINDALSKSPLYGQDVKAHTTAGIDWSSAASDASGKVKITSQVSGSQSQIAVRASTSLSVHNVIFDAAFEALATDEMQLVPWTPASTAASGTAGPNYPGWVTIDGYRTLLQEITPELDEGIKWHEDEKADSQYPTGWGRPGTRSVTLNIKGKVYGKTSFLEYMAQNLTKVNLTIQVGKNEGSIWTYCLPAVTVVKYSPSAPQDDEMTFDLQVRIGATTALEDELTVGIN